MTEKELRVKMLSLAEENRQWVIEVLRNLVVIETNLYFASWGWGSIFEYARFELGFSESEAYLRVTAARAMAEVPEIEKKIEAGTLSLTNIAKAQRFFNQEKKLENVYSTEKKKEILEQLENTSSRQADRKLASRSSNPAALLIPDTIKPVSETQSEVRFIIDNDVLVDLEKIKALTAHQDPNPTLGGLMRDMAKPYLEDLEYTRFKKLKNNSRSRSKIGITSEPKNPDQNPTETPSKNLFAQATDSQERSRYNPAEVTRTIYNRDEYSCTFVAEDGRRCRSNFALQQAHIIDFAAGGSNTVDNMRVLCSIHNRLEAFQSFGPEKIQGFMGKPSVASG